MYIYKCKCNPRLLTSEQWGEFLYSDEFDEPYHTSHITEVFYARKFWDLHYVAIKNEDDYQCGDYIRLEREDIERMLEFAVKHHNYWGNFTDVPQLCEILYTFDEAEEMGWHFYYSADW